MSFMLGWACTTHFYEETDRERERERERERPHECNFLSSEPFEASSMCTSLEWLFLPFLLTEPRESCSRRRTLFEWGKLLFAFEQGFPVVD